MSGAQPQRSASPHGGRAAQISFHDGERWSVKLELGDEEIAKLYGQGMARGAVVWRKGMVEWRPLLITPEFSDILRRTRITVPPAAPSTPETLPPSGVSFEDLTLPRPARLPFGMLPPQAAEERVPISTLAPMAADVDEPPPPARNRRPLELGAVALGAFALAWIGHTALGGPSDGDQPVSAAAMAAAQAAPGASACEPPTTTPPSGAQEKAGIRTVSVGDLPLAAGAAGKAAAALAAHVPSPSPPHATHVAANRVARSAPASSPASSPEPASLPSAPSRSDLMAAMAQVARVSSSCGERGGPVRVVVSFASSGVARSIQVSGADLPAPTRSCIIGAASRARVGAFSGDPVTVSKAL